MSVFTNRSKNSNSSKPAVGWPLVRTPPLRPAPIKFSEWSSPAIPASGYAGCDFMIGAGMVVFQPSTHKVVIVDEVIELDLDQLEVDKKGKAKEGADASAGAEGNDQAATTAKPRTRSFIRKCFLPRGRKDIGESVEQTALREAYEESGYKVTFLPLHVYNHQPAPPNDKEAYERPNTEPIYHTMHSWGPRYRNMKCVDNGGVYCVSWFVGQIPENPVHHKGVGMPDEQNYVSRIVPCQEAMESLTDPMERNVLRYAWQVYVEHHQYLQRLAEEEELRLIREVEEEQTRLAGENGQDTEGERMYEADGSSGAGVHLRN